MTEKPNSGGREQFATRIGVIMAVAGSAVGIGNYLRFPGLAAEHGGGAFMLPYFVALLLLGIPLSWAEWTMGRYGGIRGFNSAPGIFSVLWRNPAAKYFGALALMIPLVVYMYYVMIEAWCLSYAVKYITGDLMTGAGGAIDGFIERIRAGADATMTDQQVRAAAFDQYFDHFIGADQDGAALLPSHRFWLGLLIAVFLLNFACIYRGLSRGIEKLCNIGMPVLFLLSFAVLFRVLTLGTPDPSKPDQNLLNGLGFMWNPSEEALAELKNPKTWLDAAGQIFFTLSVGFGIIINYASYLRRNDDVALSSLSASAMNEFSEVCHGGLITIPAAFIFLGVAGLADGMSSTFHVGFVALPNVFDAMWGGRVFGFMWYFMLFIAAIAASVSMLQPCIAFLEEGFGLKRHASAAMLGLLAALGCGFVLYFSKNSVALDTIDFWVGTFFIFLLGMFQTFLYGWIFGIERGHRELHEGAQLQVPYLVQYVLKYVTPVYLLAIFVTFCWFNLPSTATPKFEMSAGAVANVEDGAVPESLAAALAENDLPAPTGATLAHEEAGNEWVISNAAGLPVIVLRPKTDANDVLEVSEYQIGNIEKIWRQPVAIASVGFIVVILAFLLLLAQIAGRRWQKAGRFDGLDDNAAAST